MSDADPRIEAFFAGATRWREALHALRAILRACPLEEEFKWRSPCYTAHGGNIATVWALRRACALSFFKGALLDDPQRILVAPGQNSRSVRIIEFTSADQVACRAATIRAYLLEAIDNQKAGRTVDFAADAIALPDELATALDADPALRRAFEALSPGRRRGYALDIGRAKQAATRRARVERHAPRILGGKGLHDR